MKKVLFIPHYNLKSGWGHLGRCINLSKTFADKNWKIYFYIPGKFKINLYLNKRTLVSEIKNTFYDLIFLDKYQINQKYINNLKKFCNKICIIDDFGQINFDTDFYLNYTNKKPSLSKTYFKTIKLLGLEYLIQDPNKKYKLKNYFTNINYKKNLNITIFYSSISNKDIIYETLIALKKNKYFEKFKISLILTSQIKFKKNELDNIKKNFRANIIVNERDMNRHYENSHFFIGSYGYSLIERLFCPCISICVVQFDNQLQNYNFFKNKGILINIKKADIINKKINQIIETPAILKKIQNIKLKYLKIRSNEKIYKILTTSKNY